MPPRLLVSALLQCCFVAYCLLGVASAQEPATRVVVTTQIAQTAGIDGRAWDTTFPGARTVDAVHRSVLVRFPGLVNLADKSLAGGRNVQKIELVLAYDGYETSPGGYHVRNALGEARWKSDPPRWHVVGWRLHKPWVADAVRGPTFNTSHDRHAERIGPAELSDRQTEARLDLTSSYSAADVRTALRELEDSGVLLRKLETYDARYRDADNAYEWAVPTGGHGLRIAHPRIVLTLGAHAAGLVDNKSSLPAPVVPEKDSAGPAVTSWPAASQLEALARRDAALWAAKPDWQRQRLRELYRIGGDGVSPWARALESGDGKAHRRLVDAILATPPRYWKGWEIQDDLLAWHLYRDALPAHAQAHVKRYWESWLMPNIATRELFHPQSPEAAAYWKRTQDWRGRASFFRGGYNYATSTQNFNHMAAMGALLGGDIIGSKNAIADGRHGLEHFPLRLWGVLDGSTQEMLDHYYLSITLSAQKMFADFGPAPRDRLMGQIILDRTLEMLATAYHPNLKRLIHPSGRARLPGVLVEQDGIYGVLHSLSRKGVLNYLDRPFNARVHGMPVWGTDFPPGRVTMQGLVRPWGPEWLTQVIDNKPLPFEETSAETVRGAFNPPLWRRMYLGRHYGLASQDIKGGTVDVIAQWNRSAQPVSSIEDLGTLTMRYAINEPDMATTSGGTMPYAGSLVTFQHKNRAIVCSKPRSDRERVMALAGAGGLRSLATVIALWNFRKQPGWELQVDGQPVSSLPVRARAGQLIAIRDGVSYLGIVPLPATDLGRLDEVVIGTGGGGKSEPHGASIAPALLIASHNLQVDPSVPSDKMDWSTMAGATYGGYVIELGDESEYGSFERFLARLRTNRLTTKWDPAGRTLHVEYRSGNDVMRIGCGTDYRQADAHYPVPPGEHVKAIRYRTVNGAWPYLAPGLERDTSIAQQGTSGRLEKQGAILVTDKGRKAYLQAEPITGVYTAYNPLSDPARWTLRVPGGVTVASNGKVGMLKVVVEPRRERLTINYVPDGDPRRHGLADKLLITGLKKPPLGLLNGAPLEATIEGGAYAVSVPRATP